VEHRAAAAPEAGHQAVALLVVEPRRVDLLAVDLLAVDLLAAAHRVADRHPL
jgi:hypothetical protein